MSLPASALAATLAQARMELRLTARRGENVLVTVIIPVVVLLFFASVSILPAGSGAPVDFLLPGALALAIIATSLVNLGIATAYERNYGVLKRLGGSPLTRGRLMTAKMGVVLIVEIAQLALLVAVAAVVLGWRPGAEASPAILVIALILGTLAFAGLGLLLAGALRAEATLALANGLFIAFLLLGGIVLPVSHLPGPLATLAEFLPAAALSDALPGGAGTATIDRGRPLVILAVWGVVTTCSPLGRSAGSRPYEAPPYSGASGRSRSRRTGEPTRNRTPPVATIVVIQMASCTPIAVPSRPPSSAPTGRTP